MSPLDSSRTTASSPSTLAHTAIILVDPYNDFLHENGKFHARVAASLSQTSTVPHLQSLVHAARAQKLPIYYALHQTYHPGNYAGWLHMNASTSRIEQSQAFEEGAWGSEILEGLEPDVVGNGDVVCSRHWNSSGFANTDLDYLLRQRGVTHLVLAGMVASTCLESTARYGRELYVTLFPPALSFQVFFLSFAFGFLPSISEMLFPLLIFNPCCAAKGDITSHCCKFLSSILQQYQNLRKGSNLRRTDATAGFMVAAKDAAVEHVWPLLADELLTVAEWAAKVEGFRKEAEDAESKGNGLEKEKL